MYIVWLMIFPHHKWIGVDMDNIIVRFSCIFKMINIYSCIYIRYNLWMNIFSDTHYCTHFVDYKLYDLKFSGKINVPYVFTIFYWKNIDKLNSLIEVMVIILNNIFSKSININTNSAQLNLWKQHYLEK